MDNDRWRRIEALYHAAAALDVAARATLLRDAATDPALRTEVEQLLNDHDSILDFLSRFPATLAQEALKPGEHSRPFAAGELVSGRFLVVAFLGAGGMGEVYEAEDLVLSREHVALKTLPALMADDEDAIERLKHEIALARRVTHPNVCRVFDVEQHQTSSGGRITFITMELLKGDTLAQRLHRCGPMTTTAARPLLNQIAAGLAAAHGAGVVHGDLKPANVILVGSDDPNERAVVTDFGLAHRAQAGSISSAVTTIAKLGWGTPQYMAPEQFEQRRPTYATDIYAVGTVAYEMISGKLPYEGDSLLDLALQKLHYPPRPVQEHVNELDPRWQAAIHRCLERDPDARFQTLNDFTAALDGPAAPDAPSTTSKSRLRRAALSGVIGLAVILGLLASPIRSRFTSRPGSVTGAVAAPKSVVLLPFAPSEATAAGLAFSRGLAAVLSEQIHRALELQHLENSLWVAPAAEAIDAGLDSAAAARRTLGVDLIVTGRFETKNGRTAATLGLEGAPSPSGSQPISQTFETGVGDDVLLPLTAAHVSQILGLTLAPTTVQALAEGGTTSAAAEMSYLRGRGHLLAGLGELDSAIDELQHAIQLDKSYAFAHASLTEAYRLKYIATLEPSFIPKAHASGDEAIALSPSIAYAHVTRGRVYHTTGQDERAIREFQAALQLAPRAADALRGLAEAQEAEGALEAAEDIYRRQIDQNPHYWSVHEQFGSFLFRHGRYREAETSFLNGLQYAPDNVGAISNLAGLYLLTERFTAAEVEFQKGLKLAPDVLLYNNLSWAHIFQGQFSQAIRPMEQAVQLPRANSFHWGNLARVYRWAQRPDQAKTAYETAIRLARQEIKVNPRDVQIRANLGYLYAETGHRNDALAEITSTLERTAKDMRVVFMSALVHELTGDRAAALKALEAAARGGHSIVEIRRHPDLAKLREDPQFIRMMTTLPQSAPQ